MSSDNIVNINGAMGEGGGQILRTSLALSTCLVRPFHITNIRAARKKPGLQPQHLAAVRAAAEISQAHIAGDEKGSQRLQFNPAKVRGGEYHFSVGTAGSTSLVLQTVLPALMLADAPSKIILEGGTHNPFAPPFEFLQSVYLPLINCMGPTIGASLERTGFAPKGGGRVSMSIQPVQRLDRLDICERGAIQRQFCQVLLAHLPKHIAQREMAVIRQAFDYANEQLRFQTVEDAYGPGNIVSLFVVSEHITECFTAFGQRGLPAEQVAEKVVQDVRRYLKANVPVGTKLADQLLLPLALAGRGKFTTVRPSSHTLTNIEVIKHFLAIDIKVEELSHDVWKISVGD